MSMNEERQEFEPPEKNTTAGPVTHRAVLRRPRRRWRQSYAGSLFGRIGNYSAADPRAHTEDPTPRAVPEAGAPPEC